MNTETRTRRELLISVAGYVASALVLGLLVPGRAQGATAPVRLTVYKDPACGCCTTWIAHLRENGFSPTVHDRRDMDVLKDSLGVPRALRSCHTAVAGRYLIEGHVPARDITRLISASPRNVVGLAVPGMPTGSPGMEMPGRADRYDVIAFNDTSKTFIFSTHE